MTDGVAADVKARRTLRNINDDGEVIALIERPNDRALVGCGVDDNSIVLAICLLAVVNGVVVATSVR